MVIDILIEKGYLEKCFEFEKKKGFERITKSVGNMLRISSDESLIVQKIREGIPERTVVFLTGIGKIYPILRSHKILILTVTFQKDDAAPNTQGTAEAHNDGLQSSNCAIEKCHKFTSINFSLI